MYLDIFESVLDRMLSRIGLIYPPVVLTQGCRLESQQRAQPWEVGRSHGDTDNTQHSTFSSFFKISYFFKVTPTTLNILQLSFLHFFSGSDFFPNPVFWCSPNAGMGKSDFSHWLHFPIWQKNTLQLQSWENSDICLLYFPMDFLSSMSEKLTLTKYKS